MRNKELLLGLVSFLLLLTLVFVSGCEQKDTTLKFGLLSNEEVLPIYIAEKEGLFAKHGVEIELVLFESAAERDAAVQAGAVDGAEGDLLAVALLKQGGTPVQAVSLALGATPEEGRFALLTSPASTIEKPEELAGKQIAISKNTIIEYVCDRLFEYSNMDVQQVEKVYVAKMPMRVEMLLQNRVTAAVLPDPLAALAELKGAHVLIDDTKLPVNISQSVLFFREDALKNKQDAIKGFLKAYTEGIQKVANEPQKYRNLFIEKVRIPVELQKTFPVPTFSDPQLPTADDVQQVVDWLKDKELLQDSLSYDDLVAGEIVKSLKEEE